MPPKKVGEAPTPFPWNTWEDVPPDLRAEIEATGVFPRWAKQAFEEIRFRKIKWKDKYTRFEWPRMLRGEMADAWAKKQSKRNGRAYENGQDYSDITNAGGRSSPFNQPAPVVETEPDGWREAAKDETATDGVDLTWAVNTPWAELDPYYRRVLKSRKTKAPAAPITP